ncbi:4'-phosphopantetheinyl transferase family protein [Cellulomonas sp. NS3]|uniref:4'-phosphopantetheinyl transferase family protein n=1 Tax=Cellulomonas sp. NS3 TaxID=2973977 RepID=UPI002163F9A9|nr:4'-phosphopantetheinyl transferase superfamily protein [Cellulomonas sp. NS3]
MAEPVVVDVWTAGAGTAVTPAQATVLDDAERARAGALPPPAAERFVLGRVLLRGVLAERLGCAPATVGLRARCVRCGGAHGRVRVVGPPREHHVSLTRSGPLVAVALTVAGPVGVDVESTSAVSAAPVDGVLLSPAELAGHRALPAHAAEAALARVWVRKEAALKALGTGLVADPSAWALGPPPAGARGVDAVAPGGVVVADLDVGPGRAGAVAVLGPAAPDLIVRCQDGRSVLDALRS